jgi:hypothetical protein
MFGVLPFLPATRIARCPNRPNAMKSNGSQSHEKSIVWFLSLITRNY